MSPDSTSPSLPNTTPLNDHVPDTLLENISETTTTVSLHTSTPTDSSISIRHSTRQPTQPSHFNDFVCPKNTTPRHWYNLVSFSSLTTPHHVLSAQPQTYVEPKSYTEASKHPEWVLAMNQEIDAFQTNGTWEVCDLPPEVHYLADGIILTQQKFTEELLADFGFLDAKPTLTPLPQHMKFFDPCSSYLKDPSHYRSLISKLNFLTHTRPYLAFVVQALSQFMQNPQQIHLDGVYHLLKYLKGTSGQRILLNGSNKLSLHAYSNSDWASCPIPRRSVTGYVILFGGSPISWKSKKNTTISHSSYEHEYRAMAHAAAELTWLIRLFEELGVTDLKPVTLHCDNQSALHIAKNPIFHERTKHIELDCHFT
ncbi:uncharacterized mitochondrial protein AtMg00810-like [Rutidosis leptorrhynchoides]|uniref:uncharacterized mitochondrial protein AtMg00810-like n=1 Tax=Rutidosis leptorrhynchoides TaxID=125765 RepID=UPI003A99B2DF